MTRERTLPGTPMISEGSRSVGVIPGRCGFRAKPGGSVLGLAGDSDIGLSSNRQWDTGQAKASMPECVGAPKPTGSAGAQSSRPERCVSTQLVPSLLRGPMAVSFDCPVGRRGASCHPGAVPLGSSRGTGLGRLHLRSPTESSRPILCPRRRHTSREAIS